MMASLSMMAMARKEAPGYLAARRNGAEAQLRICVVDEKGDAVSNANVNVFMGMNFRPKGYWIKGETDGSGTFLAQGKTCGDEIEIRLSKRGYYGSRRRICFANIGQERDVEDGKWLPYGATERLRLRAIENPVALHQVGFGMGKDVPATNTWIGIDMDMGEFVNPYGKGKTVDFEVMVDWDGQPPPSSVYCAAKIRFADQLSGGYYVAKVLESEFPYVYRAHEGNDYGTRQLLVVGREKVPQDRGSLLGKDAILVTRTRCTLGENGTLKSANYGFIRILSVDSGWNGRPTMRFAGVFNPTPNDTNLEARR